MTKGNSDHPTVARPPRQWVPPLLVGLAFFVTGAGFTWVSVSQISSGIDQRQEEAFRHESEELAQGVQDRVDAAQAILAGLEGLFVTGDVTRSEFHHYIAMLGNVPGADALQALEYSRLVNRPGLSGFETAVQSDTSISPDGYSDFRVFPAGTENDLFVVDYVEPMLGNESAFGFDLGTDLTRREAIEKARDSGRMVTTAAITLVQDTESSTGVLMMLPVYRNDSTPITQEERREAFTGTVNGVFRIDDLLAGLSGEQSGLRMSLTDAGPFDVAAAASNGLLSGPSVNFDQADYSFSETITAADRNWIVSVVADTGYFADPVLGAVPRIMLILGLATTAAIAVAGFALMNSRQKAADEARRATKHLIAQADELRSARDQALESDQLKTAFLANMSHELRTPLNAVIGLSGILANQSVGEMNKKQLDYAEKISSSGGHLLELIDELLELARIEAGKEELQLTRVDLDEIVTESVELVSHSSPDSRIELTKPDENIFIDADMRRLRQVILNLVTNAVKFTPLGGRVGVESRTAYGFAEVEIWDTGIGIHRDDLDKVFEPFHQIDHALSRRHEGSGLGLALSRKIVEMHGGRITVDSQPGAGSRFVVKWPLAAPPEIRPEPAQIEQTAVPIDLEGLSKTAVLAEDNEVNLMMMTDMLKVRGWEVHQARNGTDAVRLTRTCNPDLVLMDVQMPVMDGLTATRLLKSDPITAGIPVLAVTALAMAEDRDRCIESGCDGYLPKPFTPAEFEAAIHETVTRVQPVRT